MSSVIQTRCARIPRLTLAVFASTLLFADTAFATAPERVRGTVVTISPAELTIPTDQGETKTITDDADTSYAIATSASLRGRISDSYICTASNTVRDKQVALEVHIFAASMRGDGEGHRNWDELLDTTVKGAIVKSSMTKGSIRPSRPSHVLPAA